VALSPLLFNEFDMIGLSGARANGRAVNWLCVCVCQFVLDLMVAAKTNENQSLCDFVLTSPAPIDTAAKLSAKFRRIATREKARARDLAAASDYCQAMAVDLMARHRGCGPETRLKTYCQSRGLECLSHGLEKPILGLGIRRGEATLDNKPTGHPGQLSLLCAVGRWARIDVQPGRSAASI